MKNTKRIPAALLALLALAALAGCSSDSVAPHDQLPALTADDAANQAGAVAYAFAHVSPYMLPTLKADKVAYNLTGTYGLTGTIYVESADGQTHLYTAEGAPVIYTAPLGGQTSFDLDLTGAVDLQAGEVTLLAGSGGTVTSGEYVLTFTTAGLVVGSGYPSGNLTVTTGSHTVVVTFDGTVNAIIVVDGGNTWQLNLDTGVLVNLAD